MTLRKSEPLTTAIIECLGRYNADEIFPTCLSCVNFKHEGELCLLNDMRPPAYIIVRGCEKYDDVLGIPF